MAEKVKENKTLETESDIYVVENTPLTKLDSKKAYEDLKAEGFNDKEIVKIVKSIKYLPKDKLEELNTMYLKIQNDKDTLYKTHKALLQLKKGSIATLLSVCFGLLGADRFYLNDKSSGLTKLCTLGSFFFFYFYDIFTIHNRCSFLNYLYIRKVMGFEEEEFDLDKLNK